MRIVPVPGTTAAFAAFHHASVAVPGRQCQSFGLRYSVGGAYRGDLHLPRPDELRERLLTGGEPPRVVAEQALLALADAHSEVCLLSRALRQCFVFRWQHGASRPDYVSASVERVTGYSAEEVGREPDLLTERVHPDDRARYSAYLHAREAMGRPTVYRWRHRDGRWIWLELVLEPHADSNGQVTAIEGAVSDVTALMLAQEQARRLKRENEGWLADMPAIFYRVDLRTQPPRFTMSDSATRMTGHSLEALCSRYGFTLKLVHPDDLPLVRRFLENVWRTGSAGVVCRWRHADGTYHIYQHHAQADSQDGIPLELRGVAVPAAPTVTMPASEREGPEPAGATAPPGWRRVRLAVSPGMAGEPMRPARCPYCGGAALSRHQSQRRLVDDGRLEVETVRYRCRDCGRTFTDYPAGISRSTQTEAVRRVSALLYGLGLSLRHVCRVLARAGVHLSPSSVRRNVHSLGNAMRQSLPAGVRCVQADEELPAAGSLLVLERVSLIAEGELPPGVELLVWSSDTDLVHWLGEQAALLGMDLR